MCFNSFLEIRPFLPCYDNAMGALSCNCTVVPECSQTAVPITNKLRVVSVVNV